mgnify:CR=1 FL=1
MFHRMRRYFAFEVRLIDFFFDRSEVRSRLKNGEDVTLPDGRLVVLNRNF